ncbi:MAG: 50S ribosomal protein L25 [Synergistales bacterium]|nr:50S ribosomal protein L25 [Synergistales bacterium]
MSNFIPITFAERPTEQTKGTNRRLRQEGRLPGVFYGPEFQGSSPITVDAHELLRHIRHSHWETLRIEAQLPDGSKQMALIRDLQRDPITDEVLHVDFYQMVAGHKIDVTVPIEITGREECVGIKEGGVFEEVEHEIQIHVLPKDIPDAIILDVRNLSKGSVVHAQDCAIPEHAELVTDPQEVIMMVTEPRQTIEEEELEVSEETEEEMEVEVVQKGKEREEEE